MIVSTAARVSRTGAAVRRVSLPVASNVMMASPPMRSTEPRARRSSASRAMRSRSVAMI